MFKSGFVYAFLLLFGLSLQAQSQYELSIGSITPVIKDTAEMYTQLGIDFWVVNTGENTIFETITANVVSNPGEVSASRQIGWISFQEGTGLAPGDSVHFEWDEEIEDGVYDDVTPQNEYSGGDNIIVVWPAIDAVVTQTLEQYYHGLYVSADTDVAIIRELIDFKVYASSFLLEVVSEKEIVEVSIFNMEGKEVIRGPEVEISKKELSTGVYILQVEFKDGYSQSRKVMVE